MLATNGVDRLRGLQSITVVRFPSDIWEPTTNPCARRVHEVEEQLKHIQQTGGEVIEYLEA
jgi:hypothetical protein